MAEYDCYSFWVEYGGIRKNVDPGSLGLPEDLATLIDEWEQIYAATYRPDDPASSSFPDEAAEDAFNTEGLRLATRAAEALGPGWAVVYYDTLAKKLIPDSNSEE